MDFRGLTETSAPHSYWRVRDRIGPPQTESSQRSLAAHSPAADSLGSSANERVAVEALTLMANGTDVRAAATAIQALNSEPLTVPTPEEEREWVGKKRNFRGDYLTWKKFTYIRAWAWGVHLEAAQ
jgi:hypothetical protein